MKISIIVPIYNVQDYLDKCVISILNQTYKNIEILLIDDGSTDSSGVVCDKYAQNDHRIKVLHKKNGGLVSARKAGASMASGDYILNVDGDDWIEKDYVHSFYDVIIKYKPDIVSANGFYKDYDGYTCKCITQEESQEEMYSRLSGLYGFDNSIEYALWLRCVRRDLYVKVQNSIDDRIIHNEDVTCIVRMIAHTKNVYFANIMGYHYIQRRNSIVNSNIRKCETDKILLYNSIEYINNTKSNYKEELINVVKGFICRGQLLANFDGLQKPKYNFLFPYTNVKKGDRIVVFGAGKFGKKIVNYILQNSRFTFVAWGDSYAKYDDDLNMRIFSLKEIIKMDFDKVIIGTTKTLFVNEIRNQFISEGVEKDKLSVIDEDMLLLNCIEYVTDN